MVGVSLRPDLDWVKIRAAWEAGQSFGSLSRLHKVTRQAVTKRARKEGWILTTDAADIRETLTAQRAENLATHHDIRVASGKKTAANIQRVLDMIGSGATVTLCAQRIGMERAELHVWLASDPEFAQLVEEARAKLAMSRIGRIEAASERDWRAALALLERDPTTREQFAPPRPADSGGGGGAITLNINLPADLAPLLKARPVPVVIEHEQQKEAT